VTFLIVLVVLGEGLEALQCCDNKVYVFECFFPPPPPRLLKGFNCSETKIKTADGKVWNEGEFHNLSKDFYTDLSRQLAGKRVKEKHTPFFLWLAL